MQPASLPPEAAEPAASEPIRERRYDWDDPAPSAAAARDLDGLAFLHGILDGTLPGPPVARTLDFTPVTVEPGEVVFEFTPADCAAAWCGWTRRVWQRA